MLSLSAVDVTWMPPRLAELMTLQVVQTVLQCLRFYWYDAFHKGEQNCNQMLRRDKRYSAR